MFEKNLEVLKQCRPYLYDLVVNYKKTGNYKVIKSNSPKGLPNLVYNKTNQLFYDNFDPVNSVLKDLKSRKIKSTGLVFFLGLGLGYELMGVIQNYMQKDSTLIVIERDIEVFINFLEQIDCRSIIAHNRIYLFIGMQKDEVYPHLNQILSHTNAKLYAKAVNIIENPLSFTIHKDYYRAVIEAIKFACKEALMHFGNDPFDSLIGIRNTFLNINEIINYPGIKDLYDKFDNKPGIVVATGPSLNKNIHLLKGIEDKALIASVDASLRVLKRHNIKPHLVTSLERVIATSKLFEGLEKEDVKDVYLAACPVIRPETYANFPGERIIVYRNFATFHWLEIDKGILDIGSSSANMAFKVLAALGCNPIILIGQDLAFGEDEKTHAEGSTYGEKEQQYLKKERIIEVPGNYVEKIRTTDVWLRFLKAYEVDIAQYQGKVINATEGGAKIEGTDLLTFKEAIERHISDSFSPVSIIKNNLKYPTDKEIKINKEKINKKVDYAIDYCKNIIEDFKKGYDTCEEFNKKIVLKFKNNEKVNNKKARKIFADAQEPLERMKEKDFFEIIMHYVQSYYIRTMVEINGIKDQEMEPMKQNELIIHYLKDMYAVMIELINKMLEVFYELKEKLN